MSYILSLLYKINQCCTLTPRPLYTTRICEGAAGNLPDASAKEAAREILTLAHGAGEGELLVALISGGGSALLPLPPEGVTLTEKRQVSSLATVKCRLPLGLTISSFHLKSEGFLFILGLTISSFPLKSEGGVCLFFISSSSS